MRKEEVREDIEFKEEEEDEEEGGGTDIMLWKKKGNGESLIIAMQDFLF